MSRLVLDSGVVIKWFVAEPLSAEAGAISSDARAGRLTPLAPDLIYAELGNIVWKKRLHQGLPEADALAILSDIRLLKFAITPAAQLLDDAYALAVQHRRSLYDSLYLALALREGCPFVTADQRLVNALAGAVPGVTWLGHWP